MAVSRPHRGGTGHCRANRCTAGAASRDPDDFGTVLVTSVRS
jgi:hypothetical protein